MDASDLNPATKRSFIAKSEYFRIWSNHSTDINPFYAEEMVLPCGSTGEGESNTPYVLNLGYGSIFVYLT